MFQLKNTSDSNFKVSRAEIFYGRQLRDSSAFLNNINKFSYSAVRPVRIEAWKLKEEGLRTRFVKTAKVFNQKIRKLRPLFFRSRCLLQN